MARREADKRLVLKKITEEAAERIMAMPIGSETAISWVVRDIYSQHGYDLVHCGPRVGYAWSKDGGKTYAITDMEEWDVLNGVERMLQKERYLDFSMHAGRLEGLPYVLEFVIRPASERPKKSKAELEEEWDKMWGYDSEEDQ